MCARSPDQHWPAGAIAPATTPSCRVLAFPLYRYTDVLLPGARFRYNSLLRVLSVRLLYEMHDTAV